MPLLHARLHLPRRSPEAAASDDATPTVASTPVPAGDPAPPQADPATAAEAWVPVADASGRTRRSVPGAGRACRAGAHPAAPDPTAADGAGTRRAARRKRATRAPRARRSKKAPARPPVGLLPDDPVEPVDADRPLRIVLVEEVPEVVAHVREMLRGQPSLRLVEVVADGRQVAHEIRELRADVVMVDTLLQGRASGIDVLERLRATLPGPAIVALGVPADEGLAERVRAAADAVVAMPFGTIDLARGIHDAHDLSVRRDPTRATRMVAVYAAKGGVGKTTLALNLAVGLAAAGVRTALVDGSLQYGDLRRLLRVDAAEPSICDLPTDCVRASDLAATMRRGPAGVDILFAPPRLEMADMVTARDLDKILDLLRRSYQAVVIDTPSALNDTTLTVLDMADVILQVLTSEPAALDSTRAAAAAFAAIGYPSEKVQTVINRADAMGGLRPDQLRRALGREPDHLIASDWQLVSASNQDGVPFVVARPDAQVSRDVMALAGAVMAITGAAPSRLAVRVRSHIRPRNARSAAG